MRRALIVLGAATMAYAVIGAVLDPQVAKLGVVIFLVALLVLHDGVFLPLVLAAGRWTGRNWAAVVSLAVLVMSVPLALGFGRPADNTSVLPLPYARNLVLILALIWSAWLIRKGIERHRARVSGRVSE